MMASERTMENRRVAETSSVFLILGTFSIAEYIDNLEREVRLRGDPDVCAWEHFARVAVLRLDTMKRKQFVKADQSDRPGGRDPDFPGIQYRYGRDHRRRGRRVAV